MSKTYSSLSAFQQDYRYDLTDTESYLGGGTYGNVYEAYDNSDPDRKHNRHRKVAVKIGDNLMDEYLSAKDLEHDNIAKYEHCFRISDRSTGRKDYAIMELYPDGNLAKLLAERTLTDEQRRYLVQGILEGLKYLHQHKRIHRDLKPSNILIVKKGNLFVPLLADFGLTKVVQEGDYVNGSDVELSDGRGTASYKAPEQIEGEQAHFNLDLWAFGVILYEIMLGERPFKATQSGNESQRFNELLRQIKEVIIPDRINTIPQPYQDMIKRCLVKDIRVRVRKADELIGLLNSEREEKLDLATDRRDYFTSSKEIDGISVAKINQGIDKIARSFIFCVFAIILGFTIHLLFLNFWSLNSNMFAFLVLFAPILTGFAYVKLLLFNGCVFKKRNFALELLMLFFLSGFIFSFIIAHYESNFLSEHYTGIFDFERFEKNLIQSIIYLFIEGIITITIILIYLNYKQRLTGKKYFVK